jgi:hypothetical protein
MDDNLPHDPHDTGLIRVTFDGRTEMDVPLGQVLDLNAGKRNWMWGTIVEDLDDAA